MKMNLCTCTGGDMTSDKKNYVKYSLLWPTIVENYGTLINYGKL